MFITLIPFRSVQVAVDAALVGVTGTKPTIHIVHLDMTSFESIRTAAAKINAQELAIDVSSLESAHSSPIVS